MNKKTTLIIIKNIFKINMYFYTMFAVALITILIPILVNNYFIPSYKEQMLSNILDEAQKVAKHLSVKTNYDTSRIDIIDEELESEMKIFDILKVKHYDNKGNLTYSTNHSEIGEVNKNSYFFDYVAKGKIFYKIEQKGNTSFENIKLDKNVIEIYIPFLENGKFISAFELYYGIDKEIEEFEKLSKFSIQIIVLACSIGFILFFIIIFNASKNNLKIKSKQKQLKHLAHRDFLTNLYNRRYFYEMASNLLDITNRNKDDLSIAVIDIDDFKLINDKYGHNIGDFILKTFASKLKELTRKSDVVARFGGEEFIILLPKTKIDGASIIANKVCKEVSSLNLIIEGLEISFTVSIGISDYKSNQNIDEFINIADKALYLAKRNGKNRVEIL